jgi:hypothetical protein
VKTIFSAGRASALALALLFCAVAPAIAHEAHSEKPQKDVSEHLATEERWPALTPVVSGDASHDPAQHGHTADSGPGMPSVARPGSSVPKSLAWLGKFHPPATHFPIALLISAALAEFLFMRTGTIAYRHALFSAAGLVGAPGFIGGALLYGLDHYAGWV